MRLLYGLLFLPDAVGWYYSISSRVDNREYIVECLRLRGEDFGAERAQWRNSSKSIRLASRLGLSIVRLLWVLLFLPATRVEVSTVNYWSSTARFWWKREADAYMVHIGASFFYAAGGELGTSGRIPIRLASRSELSVVMVVVFGLLFLPAAGHRTADGYGGGNSFVRYWSVAAAPTSMDSAYKLDIQSNFMRTGNTQARFTGFSVRLASREVCLL